MKLFSIKTATGQTEVINADHIASIGLDFSNVIINLSNGHHVKTKFDNLDEAMDYIFRVTEDLGPLMTGTV